MPEIYCRNVDGRVKNCGIYNFLKGSPPKLKKIESNPFPNSTLSFPLLPCFAPGYGLDIGVSS